MEQIGKKFPTIKRVLIDERNMYMVQKLVGISGQHERVVAVVGDGHVPGLSKLLTEKNIAFETVRLSDLRNQKESDSGSATASFNINYKEP
jgi:pheromone shutdown protein TraB